MTKIEFEIPDEVDFLKEKISTIKWSYLAMQILQERIRRVSKYNDVLSKSKATDMDAEELTNEIKEAVWESYSKQK